MVEVRRLLAARAVPGVQIRAMNAKAIRGLMSLWLAMVAAVVVVSLLPSTAPPGHFGIDKVAHTMVYLVLAIFPAAVLPRTTAVWSVMLLLVIVGVGVELAQSHIVGRQGSAADVLANAAGIALGALAGRQIWRRLALAHIATRSTRTGAPGLRGPDK